MAERISRDSRSFTESANEQKTAEMLIDLAKAFKVPPRVWHAIYTEARRSGRPRMPSDDDFASAFPQFQAWVTTCPRSNIQGNAGLGKIFDLKKFESLFIYKRFLEDKEEVLENPNDSHVMLVPWPRLGTLAMHDIDLQSPQQGVRMVFSTSNWSQPIILESLHDLVQRFRDNGCWPAEDYG